jgi:hypothetical protein
MVSKMEILKVKKFNPNNIVKKKKKKKKKYINNKLKLSLPHLYHFLSL